MKASSPAADPSRSASIEAWFASNARTLPWRETYDPYHVWTSEVMLQQTRVETMLPYYRRWLERFPTLPTLAAAPEDAVLGLWSGLGYYNRARNFRRAAIEVVARHGGEVPRDYDALIALPGIGRYMAGAILSIAFDQPRPIVDGNVRRVVSRFNGWKDPAEPAIWDEAARLVGEGAPRMVNQGLMELGATVCTVRAPRCGVCPWKPECVAARDGTPDEIPVPRKRPATVRVDLCAVIDRNAHGVLMKENDGLWEFPMLGSLPEGEFEKVGHCRHAITHHRIEVDVYRGRLPNRRGYRRVRPESLPMTSLTRKVYRAAQGEP